jgi:hypothetical protein
MMMKYIFRIFFGFMSSENQSNSNIDTLKNISKSLDIILDKPADQWSQKEINIYHLLQNTLDKYKIRYSLTQFKLDVNDIKKNVKSLQWYQESPYQKTLSWILDQLVIKSYQHSKKNGEFRLTARFTQSQIRLLIAKKASPTSSPIFYYLLENEITNIKTKELDNVDNMIQIFGINKNIDPDKQHQIILDIAKLIYEIGLFYN